MNVLIIEMGGSHAECIYSFVQALRLKSCKVHLLCNDKLLQGFPGKDQLEGIIALPDLSFMDQVKMFWQIRRYIRRNRIRTVIFNTTEVTLVRNLCFFLPRINLIGVVHNARKLEKSFTFSNVFFKKIKKYLVLSDYLLQELQVPAEHHIDVASFYPVYFPASRLEIYKDPQELWVTIPGTVLTGRREYVPFLQSLLQQPLQENIRFIVLGNLDICEEVKQLLAQEEFKNKNILVFDKELEYDLFHAYMQKTDIILPLLKIREDNFYNTKRISGSFNLGVGYRLPFLLPASYNGNTDLQPFSFYYNNYNELHTTLNAILNDKSLLTTRMNAYSTDKFSMSILSDKLYSFILKNSLHEFSTGK
jgi:hypothetical protein